MTDNKKQKINDEESTSVNAGGMTSQIYQYTCAQCGNDYLRDALSEKYDYDEYGRHLCENCKKNASKYGGVSGSF